MDGDSNQRGNDNISIVDPLSRAMVWSRDVLFRPFDLTKWFVLGFCAWLAMLGERGGPSSSGNWGKNRGDHRTIEDGLYEAWEWVLVHWVTIVTIVGIAVFVILAIWLLFLWLSSRGKFMFLDGVVHNRAAVAAPWRQFRERANALFVFRIVVGLIGTAIVIAFLAFVALLVLLGIRTPDFSPLLIAIGIFGLLVLVTIMIGFTVVGLAINDFVVPLMYLRDRGVGAAWRELGALVSARPGVFVLYVLIKIVIAIAVAAISILACCLTCCIAALPYIGTVILLPVWVFARAFPLYFLGQFGPQYARFATLGPLPEVEA
jgi:hypothetical protein